MRGVTALFCVLLLAGGAASADTPQGPPDAGAKSASEAAPGTNAAGPRAAVPPPTVVCVENLTPRDGWKKIGASGSATTGTATDPPPGCAADVRWGVRMESNLAFHVKGYKTWSEQGDNKRITLHVFIEGIELQNLTPHYQGQDGGDDVLWTPLKFESRRGSEDADRSRDTWAQVLRIARNKDSLRIAIGPEGGPYWASTATMEINPFPTGLAWFAGAVLALLLVGLVVLGVKSWMLRDNNGTQNPPYSLGRHQMAVWLVVVIGAFLYVTMSTGAAAATSTTALVLIGISGATGLVAVAMDKSKRQAAEADTQKLVAEQTDLRAKLNQAGTGLVAQEAAARAAAPGSPDALALAKEIQTANDRLAAIASELAEIPQPVQSRGWLLDMLSDEGGVSLHRLQIAVWTIVFVGVFVVAVWRTFAMPDFDATTLGLMGISSGLYLGFKFPEKAS